MKELLCHRMDRFMDRFMDWFIDRSILKAKERQDRKQKETAGPGSVRPKRFYECKKIRGETLDPSRSSGFPYSSASALVGSTFAAPLAGI